MITLSVAATNSIYNATLWDLVAPESLLGELVSYHAHSTYFILPNAFLFHSAWQRVRAANQLSSTGSDWFEIIALHNSGTYNNQVL